jgi:hypothetical protein
VSIRDFFMVDGPYSISIFTASGRYDSDREPEPGNVAVLPNGSVYLIVRKWKIGMEVPKMAAPEVKEMCLGRRRRNGLRSPAGGCSQPFVLGRSWSSARLTFGDIVYKRFWNNHATHPLGVARAFGAKWKIRVIRCAAQNV